MSKRKLKTMEDVCTNVKKPKHWSLGLVETMKDPTSIVKQTERVVVIKDKYPKAKIHYLILPHDNINSIYKLTNCHVSLLEEFGELYSELKEKHKEYTLHAGFHAVPSMQRLHMHIISMDMISPCLKTKIHWNSFTTKFFKPYEDVLQELKQKGHIEKISNDLHKNLMTTQLMCNQCSYKPKNMPQLKDHLLTHLK